MNEIQIRQIFATNLRRALRKKGLAQKDLAEKVHVTGEQVSRWVTAKNPPGWEAVASICTSLNLKLEDLFFEEERQIEPRQQELNFAQDEIELFKRFQHFQKAFAKIS